MLVLLCSWLISSVGFAANYETVIMTDRFLSQHRVRFEYQVTREQLDQASEQSLDEILTSIPGLVVTKSNGQPSSVFFRGAKSEAILVVLDGIVLNDPTSPTGGFDFSTIDPNLLDDIRIMGPEESVNWGGGALGGLIWLRSRKALQSQKRIGIELGTHEMSGFRLSSENQNESNHQTIATVYHRQELQESIANNSSLSAQEPEKERLIKTTGLFKNNQDFLNLNSDVMFYFVDRKSDLDSAGPIDDGDAVTQSQQIVGQWSLLKDSFLGKYSRLDIKHSRLSRLDSNPGDAILFPEYFGRFYSVQSGAALTTMLAFHPDFNLQLKADYLKDSSLIQSQYAGSYTEIAGESEQKSLSSSADVELPFMTLRPGFRREFVSANQADIVSIAISNSDQQNPKAGLVWTKGLKWPTLYQTASTFGNPNLSEEKVETLSLSLVYPFTNLKFKATFFQAWYRDLIDFDLAAFKYFNQNRVNAQGAEIQINFSFFEFGFNEQYTRDENQLQLLRRPRQTAYLKVTKSFVGFDAQFYLNWKGVQEDNFGVARDQLNPYFDAKVKLQTEFRNRMNFEIAIWNFFNDQNEEMYGFHRNQRKAEFVISQGF